MRHFRHLKLFYHTVKYLSIQQTAGRVLAGIKRRLIRPREFSENSVDPGLLCRRRFLFHDPYNSRKDILENTYTFLNSRVNLKNSALQSQPLLWQFNYHYFAYLHLLNESEKERLCLEWISLYTDKMSYSWHSYPLSLRIVNWIKNEVKHPDILKSIKTQVDWLYRNTEFYFPGNHLLENAKALLFAGLFFRNDKESSRWYEKGIKIFREELGTQVLSDGGYFERTTMYHALMLECILDIMNILNSEDDLKFFRAYAIKMSEFLKAMTHPNGKITLVNDSTEEIAPPVKELIEYAESITEVKTENKTEFTESGYYVYSDGFLYICIDAGVIGPDYLPAHAHSDIFSFEISIGKEKVISDTGVFEYRRGAERDYCRSSSAHNTISIDEISHIEVWDSFRVARRYAPYNISMLTNDSGFLFEGEYNGFSEIIGDGIVCRRTIRYSKKSKTLEVRDFITGFGNHSIKSFLHFMPDFVPAKKEEVIIMSREETEIMVKPEKNLPEIKITDYSPYFGVKLSRPSLVFITKKELPCEIGYSIHF